MSQGRPADVDPIVAFYRGERPDASGRHLANILDWDDRQLEAVHDYIQWVFPTSQPSAVNVSAPLVTRETVAAFHADEELRGGLLRSFDRILRFYGLERVQGDAGVEIRPGVNYEVRKTNWLHPGNHNHLRITRILTSLRLLGLPDEAAAFRRCLLGIYDKVGSACISGETLRFWMRAG